VQREARRGSERNAGAARGEDGPWGRLHARRGALPEALRKHYLPGAINLPYEFVDEAEKVLPDKDVEAVVYCMNPECTASAEEARELEEMGYGRVLHHAAGKQDWIRAGLPVEGRRAAGRSSA
jgi:rhodanese-related sulfurtransferase